MPRALRLIMILLRIFKKVRQGVFLRQEQKMTKNIGRVI